MDNSKLDSALRGLDEKYLIEFEKSTAEKTSFALSYKRIIPVAACFIVVIVGIALARSGLLKGIPTPANTDGSGSVVHGTISTQTTTAAENIWTSADKENTTEMQTQTSTQPDVEASTVAGNTDNTTLPEPKTESSQKGGGTSELPQNNVVGPDGGYYRIFQPGTDTFNPHDRMTLENRFCSFNWNGNSYYPAVGGEISENDFEPTLLGRVKASFYELLTPDEDVVGIEYVATVEIYKLCGIETDEAVACKISFNGETKEYKYNASDIICPSWQP